MAIRFSNALAWILVNFDINPDVAISSGVTYNNLKDGFPDSMSSYIGKFKTKVSS